MEVSSLMIRRIRDISHPVLMMEGFDLSEQVSTVESFSNSIKSPELQAGSD
jgi:hypothetical protein